MPPPDLPIPAASGGTPASRRTFLRGLLGVVGAGALGAGSLGALSGCDVFGGDSAPPADPVPPALAGFLTSTVALANRYDAALAAVDSLPATVGQIRDAHRAHVKALAQAIGVATPSAVASPAADVPTSREEALTALITAEKAAHDEAVTECLASTPRFAALLGSIAAERATNLLGLSA